MCCWRIDLKAVELWQASLVVLPDHDRDHPIPDCETWVFAFVKDIVDLTGDVMIKATAHG